MIKELNIQQKKALKELLYSKKNIFLTGAAGTGKSHLIKIFKEVKKLNKENIPIVASTGAAALLVNGVTFNSYFGLGILSGGIEATVTQAMNNRSVCERIIYTDTIIVDEISMISSEVLTAADLLCKKIRRNKLFLGGIRVIFVGDFLQLGPFSETDTTDWVFDSPTWKKAKIKKIELTEIMRTKDKNFLKILNKVRLGKVDLSVSKFLNTKIYKKNPLLFEGTRIFSRNHQVDSFNQERLREIPGEKYISKTLFVGDNSAINKMKDNLVIPEFLELKKGALVMFRVNNFKEGYVNGTLGHIISIGNDVLTIKKINGEIINVKKHVFEFVNGSGEVLAKAKNYPLILAWAITINKAQGASLDKALISLDKLWLHGQAYTALSRLSSSTGLHILKWDKSSFIVDKKVIKFLKSK